jgi:hypothetical protein
MNNTSAQPQKLRMCMRCPQSDCTHRRAKDAPGTPVSRKRHSDRRIKRLPGGANRNVFSIAGWILRALPAEPDRRLLRHRILKKLYGVRRGKLRLPLHFPAEVRALSELTTGQLRETVYAFNADDGTDYYLDKTVVSYIHQVFPDGRIRTVHGDNSVHDWQSKRCKPLSKHDWPRLETRPAWPSSPTLPESWAMARNGQVARPLQTRTNPAKRRIMLSEFNSNIDLAKRIIATNVVGIRSDIKIPSKYLGYFRYRWNFLVLTGAYNLSSGLARFLAGQWMRNPHNLWLQDKTSFKTFLKKTDRARFPCFQPGPW